MLELPITVKYPGKCILFGEHAVVYGFSAISVAINLFSECTILSSKDKKNHLKIENYNLDIEFLDLNELSAKIPEQFTHLFYGLSTINKSSKLKLDEINRSLSLDIVLRSELWHGSGLGSSASTSAAFITAFCKLLKFNISKESINEIVYNMEKFIHKTPSGIDNSTCVYGGILKYKNKEVFPIQIKNPFELLLIYTGVPHDTGNVVKNVRHLLETNKKKTMDIFKRIGYIAEEAEEALITLDNGLLMNLLNENHLLLKELNVSNKEIERIREILSGMGLKGVKLTGAGLGGCVLCVDKSDKLRIACKRLKSYGFDSKIVSIYQNSIDEK